MPKWYRRIGNTFSRSPNDNNFCSWREQVDEINRFFAQQPHEFKIFIPGCWECWSSSSNQDIPTAEKIQSAMNSGIYLEDASCRILGLNIYGSSWTAADDLRPEDGAYNRRHLSCFLRSKRSKHSDEISTSEQQVVDFSSINSSLARTHKQNRCYTRADGFVLPDIKDVAAKWEQIPEDTDVVVTHMPAWRQELFAHIAERVKPTLHLCGHDFAGYGVMWKRDTLFSNAALQLNSAFPHVMGFRKTETRKLNRPTAETQSSPSSKATSAAINQTDCNSSITRHPSSFDPDFREPSLYIPKPNGRPRPPRWQRRLPRALSRLFLSGGGGSGTGGTSGCPTTCSIFRRSLRPQHAVRVSETHSSRAAATHVYADTGFIYDPDMRAGIGAMAIADSAWGSGSGAGYSGGSTALTGSTLCSSICRRNPIVIDVYVVGDDLSLRLPPYAHASENPPHSTEALTLSHSPPVPTLGDTNG
ncbi:unnamed protein product [Dicrocoelium dendriticum]|nr:unnamed protein product [Dicrocoelium dendriticum]